MASITLESVSSSGMVVHFSIMELMTGVFIKVNTSVMPPLVLTFLISASSQSPLGIIAPSRVKNLLCAWVNCNVFTFS